MAENQASLSLTCTNFCRRTTIHPPTIPIHVGQQAQKCTVQSVLYNVDEVQIIEFEVSNIDTPLMQANSSQILYYSSGILLNRHFFVQIGPSQQLLFKLLRKSSRKIAPRTLVPKKVVSYRKNINSKRKSVCLSVWFCVCKVITSERLIGQKSG